MNKRYIYLVLLVVIAAAAIYFIPRKTQAPDNNNDVIAVYDFVTCEHAGYPVEETEPRSCMTPEGKVYSDTGEENPEVVVDMPMVGDKVSSPLKVEGKARGFWFFEANIPVTLKDSNGKVLAHEGFMATENWMTSDYVKFEGTLTFSTPTTDTGTLFIEKDNPSGDPSRDASFAVPVRFK